MRNLHEFNPYLTEAEAREKLAEMRDALERARERLAERGRWFVAYGPSPDRIEAAIERFIDGWHESWPGLPVGGSAE